MKEIKKILTLGAKVKIPLYILLITVTFKPTGSERLEVKIGKAITSIGINPNKRTSFY